MGGTINAKRDYQQINSLKITQSVTPVTTIAAVIFVLHYLSRSFGVCVLVLYKRNVQSSSFFVRSPD